MGKISDRLGYTILKFIAPKHKYAIKTTDAEQEVEETKLQLYFGNDFFVSIRDKVVIDFGCGKGIQSVEMAQKGASKVIGLDIQEHLLEYGKEYAEQNGLNECCVFKTTSDELADIIISKDAFEHFSDPSAILQVMSTLLKPDGYVLAAFGPTWLHPYGGHLFSVFPWSHLLFTEKAQIQWRADFKTDGATKFLDVAGGLNQLTISEFEKIIATSPFEFEWLETIPIKGISLFKSKFFREIGTSIVRCKLKLKANFK